MIIGVSTGVFFNQALTEEERIARAKEKLSILLTRKAHEQLAAQQLLAQQAQQARLSENDLTDFMSEYCGRVQRPSYTMAPVEGAPPLPALPPPPPPAEPTLSSALAKLRAKKAAKQMPLNPQMLSAEPPPPPPPQQPPLMMALERLRKIHDPSAPPPAPPSYPASLGAQAYPHSGTKRPPSVPDFDPDAKRFRHQVWLFRLRSAYASYIGLGQPRDSYISCMLLLCYFIAYSYNFR